LTFHFEMKKVKDFLCKNAYPPHLIEKQVKKYLNKVQSVESQQKTKDDKENTFYVKLPFIGEYSKVVQNKVARLCSNLCKETNIKLVFTSKKVSSIFSTKDKIPSCLRANVIYHFQCASCNASYVGKTTRHYDVRVHEHLYKQSQPTSVYKHLEEKTNCRLSCDESCFSVIDNDSSPFRLQIKEAIHNEWLKPIISKQRKLLKLSILV